MLSGGLSPFWAGNDLKTEARVLGGDYRLDLPHFNGVSDEAKNLISNLILLQPDARITAQAGWSFRLLFRLLLMRQMWQ